MRFSYSKFLTRPYVNDPNGNVLIRLLRFFLVRGPILYVRVYCHNQGAVGITIQEGGVCHYVGSGLFHFSHKQ